MEDAAEESEMSRRKDGLQFEHEFCEWLAGNGFFAHNLLQGAGGQPADIIAVRNGRGHLIDCKLCQYDHFEVSRIEPNQDTAMRYWRECGNETAWFALKLSDGTIRMIPYYAIMMSQGILHRKELELYKTNIEWEMDVP